MWHDVFVPVEKKEQEEDEKEEFEEERSFGDKRSVQRNGDKRSHVMVSVFQFIMKQSYICALISMMVCMRDNS